VGATNLRRRDAGDNPPAPARALRVALVRGGRIVEERVALAPVTVGSSARATLAVPVSDLPPSLVLFEGGREGPALVVGDRMEGWLGDEELRAGAGPRALALGASGRVLVGEATVLFEVVPAPAPVRPAPLPAAARGDRFRSLDRLFVAVLAASLAVHVGAYLGLAATPVREEVTLEEIPDRFAKLLIPERRPEPVAREEKKPEPVAEKKRPEEKPREEQAAKQEPAPAQQAEAKAARQAAVAKAVQSKGLLRVLGSLGAATGGAPAVAEVFGGAGEGGMGDVAQALSGVGTATAASASGPAPSGGRRGGGAGEAGAATIGALAASSGARKVDYGAKTEVAVAASVAGEAADIDSADVDGVKLASFVRARMGAIKACYEAQLKRNPALHGRLRVRFTILETGALEDVHAAEDGVGSPEVSSCVVGTIRAWRTPFRPSGPVTVDYPFVFSAS
jgi:outer membrane biosynthesis protein TonB